MNDIRNQDAGKDSPHNQWREPDSIKPFKWSI